MQVDSQNLTPSPLDVTGDSPYTNPLFSNGYTPQTAGSRPRMNPVWSPGDRPSAEPDGMNAMPPPPMDFLSAEAHPAGMLGEGVEGEEAAFADVVAELMQGHISSPEAVARFAEICEDSAAGLREEAVIQQQRVVRALHLQEMAACFDAEAATWRLLWHLYGVGTRTFPGSLGGPKLPGCPGASTVAQHIAVTLEHDAELNRLGRVIVWLEELAGSNLDRAEAEAETTGSSAAFFTPGDGMPRETLARMEQSAVLAQMRPASHATVSQLDPDAPTRQGMSWVEGDAREEERLMARLFRLLRCGRLEAARQLCQHVGQPWRAASLGSSGGMGLTPLGIAAEDADAAPDDRTAEQLCSETELGRGTLRALWRWASFQASERIAQSPRGSAHEAALYGALSSNVQAVYPVCRNWTDYVWALARSWLEAALDCRMRLSAPDAGAPSDALLAALPDSSAQASVFRAGLAVGQGRWPTDRLMERLPKSLRELLSQASQASAARGFQALPRVSAQHQAVQQELILGDADEWQGLLIGLLPSLKQAAMDAAEGSGHSAGALGFNRDANKRQQGMLRFSAHLGLSLPALGLLPLLHDMTASLAFRDLQDSCNVLVQQYLVELMDSGQHSLMPVYACHLRADERREIYTVFLNMMTAAHSMEACEEAFSVSAQWFEAWAQAGQGDVDAAEMAIIVQQVSEKSRWALSGGPMLRAQSARWLWFATATLERGAAHANQLLREFALCAGPGPARAAQALLALLPAELQEALSQGVFDDVPGITEELYGALTELRAWAAYFSADRLYREWEELRASVMGERGRQVSAEEGTLLRAKGLSALHALLQVVTERVLDFIAPGPTSGQALAQHLQDPLEFVLVAAEERGTEASEACSLGQEYGVLEPEAASAAAEAITEGLAVALRPAAEATRTQRPELLGLQAEAHSAAQRVLPGGGLGEPLEGAAEIAASCSLAEGLPSIARLLADAIKGHLPGSPRPLQVVNMVGSEAVQAAICQNVLYSRSLLRCAALRETLLSLGAASSMGASVVELVAGAAGDGGGFAQYFAPAELGQLLEMERRAVVHAKASDSH